MATIIETMTAVNAVELLSVVWVEVTMASLAALVWFTVSGSILLPKGSKKLASEPGKQSPRLPYAVGSEQSTPFQMASKVLRQGKLSEGIALVLQLPETLAGQIPASIAPRLLMAVAKAPDFDEALVQLKVLAGKVEARALEAAMLEACKNKDAAACRQLQALSAPMQILKTPRTLEALARVHASDIPMLRILVEDAEAPLGKCFAGAVLEACAAMQEIDLAVDVFEKVAEVDAAALRAVAEKASQSLGNPGADKHSKRSSPDATLAKEIRAFGKSGDINAALKLFDQSDSQFRGAFLYNTILEACIESGSHDKAVDYFSQAESDGLADTVTYNIMMKGYLAHGDDATAARLLEKLSEKGLSASHSSYHSLLNSRVCAHDHRGAWKLVEEMKAGVVLPNMVTCSILLKSKANGANEVSHILEMVDATGQKMDDVLFATVVEACARTNCFDLLSKQTSKFAREGGSLALTAPTYGSMIKAYGQMWDVKRVWELWGEMTGNNIQPTAITLGCMVEALVSNRRTAEAWQLVQETLKEESTRLLVNTVIYSTIIKGFACMKDISKVMSLYDEMRAHGCQPNTITYNTILNAFAQGGAMDRLPALLEDMKTASPPVEPDLVTYSTIVKGFCSSGCLDRALQIVEQMRASSKYMPDEVMYNSLLDGCAKQQRPGDALILLEAMKKSGVAPSNFTLSMLVKLMGRCKRLKQAFSLIEEITSEYNLKVNIQVYTCLITACFDNRQAFKAIALHDQITKEGVQPDAFTYNVLVQGCLKAGLVDKAVQLAKCACGVGALKGKGMRPGVGERCLAELISAVGGAGSSAGKTLEAELGEFCVAPKGKGKGKGSSKGSGAASPQR